jgi:hypothetical protein
LLSQLFKTVLVFVIAGTALWWAQSGAGSAGGMSPAPKPTAARRLPLAQAGAGYHGLAWQISSSDGCVELARKMLGEIADLGADSVLISTAGYQEHAGSDAFHLDPKVAPSPEQWTEIFKIAHENGLRVVLMPIILLSNPRGTEWRGVINPPSWDDWFEQYRKFLAQFARIAEAGKVEVLAVGSELVSTERYTEQWRRVIAETRKIYHGKLTYSANWDHYKVVEFWDDLDMVGMTSYYKLSNDPNPTMATLVEAWKPIKRGLLRWQEETGKPLLFTEVGWCSQEGTSIEPWNYYYRQTATPEGLKEQANCYRAFMEAWSDVPEVGGVFWWEWTNTAGGPEDFNYSPKGKPAERVLRDWFDSVRGRAASASKPAADVGLRP